MLNFTVGQAVGNVAVPAITEESSIWVLTADFSFYKDLNGK